MIKLNIFKTLHSYCNYFRKFKFSTNFKFIENDINYSVAQMNSIIDNKDKFNINSLLNNFDKISNNLSQLEFKREEKINSILQCYSTLFKKLKINEFINLLQNESNQKILNEIIKSKNFKYFSNDSSIIVLLLLNLLKNKNNLYQFDEIKFWINFGISSERKIVKFIKFGKFIFKNKIKSKDKIFYNIFVNLSNLDDSNLPIKIELTRENLGVLIYAKYLDYLNKEIKLEDYVKLLEKYFLILEEDEINCDIEIKFKILESVVNLLDKKKEFPILKIVCDVLLAYFRQYKNDLNFFQLTQLFNILSHDNFLKIYDVDIFKNHFYFILNEKLKNIEEVDQSYLVELIYSFDKIYKEEKPLEIIDLILNKNIIEKDFSNLIENVFKFNQKTLEEIKTFYSNNINTSMNISNYIQEIESQNNISEKYKIILKLKFYLKYLENNDTENEILKSIKIKF